MEEYVRPSTKSLLSQLHARELGLVGKPRASGSLLTSHQRASQICWRRREVPVGSKNKIFASQWLSRDHVIYGTKCNSLCVYEVASGRELQIPLLKSSPDPLGKEMMTGDERCNCGIHAIQLNPSGTLMATGADNVNHVGVYRLPELTPLCVLEKAHRDWVFDIRWLDDEYLATCSRDASLALWRVNPEDRPFDGFCLEGHGSLSPEVQESYDNRFGDDRFRAIEFLPEHRRLVVLAMGRRLHFYDPVRLLDGKSRGQLKLVSLGPEVLETVSLRRCPSRPELVALSSQRAVLCFDIRVNGQPVIKVDARRNVLGIRSVNFRGDMLSYGTSQGEIHFYDLRSGEHVPAGSRPQSAPQDVASNSQSATYMTRGELNVGPGWIRCEPNPPFLLSPSTAAVYTHEYDPTGTRLFSAGGPIAAAFYGNVACLWE